MLTKLKKRNEGFTIVETLIVLAIAGLIILIVLLAVPALQRNAKNSDIKSDAEAIASAISEYEENNSGGTAVMASQAAGTSPTYTVGASGTNTAVAKIQQADKIVVQATMPTATTQQTAGTITIVQGFSCSGTVNGSNTAIWYALATGTSSYSFYTHDNSSCLDT
jgi:prepilin-type N-terminal cleavage/methylation domain-containing protein